MVRLLCSEQDQPYLCRVVSVDHCLSIRIQTEGEEFREEPHTHTKRADGWKSRAYDERQKKW